MTTARTTVAGHGFSRRGPYSRPEDIRTSATSSNCRFLASLGMTMKFQRNPHVLRGVPKALLLLALLAAPLIGQEPEGSRVPSVTMLPAPVISVHRGSVGTAELRFRVGAGFHVNSNTPTEEYLIPTTLQLDAPTDIIIGRVTYPAGDLESFPFAPDQKLSVYSGEFSLSVVVRALSSVLPGPYAVHGQLKYQACDNAACYPPKRLPVEFNVKVVKAPPPPRKNPGQSPHVHN
jgi:hypothetical protein